MKLKTILFLISGGLLLIIFGFTYSDSFQTESSGSISGTIILSPRNAPVRFGGGLYQRPTANKNSSPSPDSALVILVSKNSPVVDLVTEKPFILDQFNQAFNPKILPIRVGNKVRIRNSDPVYHNVFSLSETRKFDVGRRPRGEHFDVSFDKTGVVDVFCDIHSNMHAIIYVMPKETRAWKKIQSGESFNFENVPDGSYELRIYARGYEEQTIDVELTSSENNDLGTLTLIS